MKKIFTSILVLVIFLLNSSSLHAQTDSIEIAPDGQTESDLRMIMPPYEPQIGFLGQSHAYSVTLRGNGEAVVSGRFSFANTTTSSLDKINLRFPAKVNPEDIIVYQVLRDPVCVQYDYATRVASNYKCVQYQEPNYFEYYGQSKYQKAKTSIFGDNMMITLPRAVAPDKSGAYFVYYRTLDFTDSSAFNAFDYEFETFKFDENIQEISVGISTDSDLKLKGATGEVGYRNMDPEMASITKSSSDLSASANPQFDSFYAQIGQGQINKYASNLAPLESYKVEGKYAKGYLGLYGVTVMKIVGGLIVGSFVLGVLVWHLYKRLTRRGDSKRNESTISLFMTLATSFVSAFAVLVYISIMYFFVINNFFEQVNYQLVTFFMLLVFLVSAGYYLLVAIVPPFLIGLKRGVVWGIVCFVLINFWLVGFFIFAILFIGNNGLSNNFDTPVMRSGVDYGSTDSIENPAPMETDKELQIDELVTP